MRPASCPSFFLTRVPAKFRLRAERPATAIGAARAEAFHAAGLEAMRRALSLFTLKSFANTYFNALRSATMLDSTE